MLNKFQKGLDQTLDIVLDQVIDEMGYAKFSLLMLRLFTTPVEK